MFVLSFCFLFLFYLASDNRSPFHISRLSKGIVTSSETSVLQNKRETVIKDL